MSVLNKKQIEEVLIRARQVDKDKIDLIDTIDERDRQIRELENRVELLIETL